MTYQVVQADASHIAPIAAGMRQADRNEVWATAGIIAEDAVKLSLEHSEIARTWLVDGLPASIGGITRISETVGTIWLLGTDAIDRHQRAFIVDSCAVFAEIRKGYDALFNFVDVRNEKAVRWLKWLRFSEDGPYPYGVFRQPFLRLFWERKK